MPDDVAGARLSLRLYSPRPHWFDAIAQRKMRVVAIYAAYLLVIVASVVGFESLPPQYEVSAMIDLQPMAYTAVDEQRFRTSKADEMARSQIALLTTESVIRGALADLSRPPALPIPVPLPQKAPKDIPVASSAYASTERLAARSGLEGARPARDPVRTANASTSMYEASALATGHATTSISKGIDGLRDLVTLAKETVWPPLAPADESYVAARKAIKSQAEPNTGLIRVSFTDRDPAYAVRFLDALIQRFTDKHYDLYSNAGAVSFFVRHRKESEEEFAKASAELAAYSAANDVFNIDEQRKLLLQERSRVISDFAATRDLQAQKESEATSIADQLVQMKPFSRYPQINSLAQTGRRLRPVPEHDEDATSALKPQAAEPKLPNLTGDPPLLLVRVYQDTIATLVKLNTDLAGLRARRTYQQSEIATFDRKLADLSAKEAAYERIRQRADLAKATAAQFAKKAVDEQIQQDLNAQKLSTVRIVQPPTPPIEPVWPRRRVVLIALLLAALPAFAIAGPAAYRRFAVA